MKKSYLEIPTHVMEKRNWSPIKKLVFCYLVQEGFKCDLDTMCYDLAVGKGSARKYKKEFASFFGHDLYK